MHLGGLFALNQRHLALVMLLGRTLLDRTFLALLRLGLLDFVAVARTQAGLEVVGIAAGAVAERARIAHPTVDVKGVGGGLVAVLDGDAAGVVAVLARTHLDNHVAAAALVVRHALAEVGCIVVDVLAVAVRDAALLMLLGCLLCGHLGRFRQRHRKAGGVMGMAHASVLAGVLVVSHTADPTCNGRSRGGGRPVLLDDDVRALPLVVGLLEVFAIGGL